MDSGYQGGPPAPSPAKPEPSRPSKPPASASQLCPRIHSVSRCGTPANMTMELTSCTCILVHVLSCVADSRRHLCSILPVLQSCLPLSLREPALQHSLSVRPTGQCVHVFSAFVEPAVNGGSVAGARRAVPVRAAAELDITRVCHVHLI
jgi:hypothetical protein